MMKKIASTRLKRGIAFAACFCLFSGMAACSKDDDGSGGGDGDGDGDGGAGPTGESCTVEDNEDGTATITCPDGSEATVSTENPEEVETCSVEDMEDGTAVITCPDGSETVVSTTPPQDIETCMAVTEGSQVTVSCPDGTSFVAETVSTLDTRVLVSTGDSLMLYEVASGKSSATQITSSLTADEELGPYTTSMDNEKVVYMHYDEDGVANLYLVNVSGDPTAPVMLNEEFDAVGTVYDFQISPDGNFVAYTADPDTNEQIKLFVVDISAEDPGDPVEVSGDFEASSDVNSYSFSGDSRLLAYNADPDPGVNELFVVDLSDPSEGERVNASLEDDQIVDDTWFGFSPDSASLFYLSDEETEGHRQLMVANVEDGDPGAPKVVSETTAGTTISSYAVSPDGSWVVYQADEEEAATMDLYLVSLDDLGSAELLYEEESGATHGMPMWSGDSSYIVWMSDLLDVGEAQQLLSIHVDDAGEDPMVLNPDLPDFGQVETFAMNSDGDWIAFTADVNLDEKFELFVVAPDGEDEATWVSTAPKYEDGVGMFQWAQSANVLSYASLSPLGVGEHFLLDLADGLPGASLAPAIRDGLGFESGGLVSEDGTVAASAGYVSGLVFTDWSGASVSLPAVRAYPEFLH